MKRIQKNEQRATGGGLPRVRGGLTYANVMSTVAVFGVLGGGGAYAAGKIGAEDIERSAVRAKHIKRGAVLSRHIKPTQIRATHLRNGAVTAPKLACKGNGSGDTMIAAGAVCVDKYEVSIWTAPEGGRQITGPIPCNPNGQDCDRIFARSVPGVRPAVGLTWFQAQQALANVGKRLPTNVEWQQAVAATPDPGAGPNGSEDCHTDNDPAGPVATGLRSRCVSRWGAHDMVGNLVEWVADWDEEATACGTSWSPDFGSDLTCVGRAQGDVPTRFPGAFVRGGAFDDGAPAGPFFVDGKGRPSGGPTPSPRVGFRGAR